MKKPIFLSLVILSIIFFSFGLILFVWDQSLSEGQQKIEITITLLLSFVSILLAIILSYYPIISEKIKSFEQLKKGMSMLFYEVNNLNRFYGFRVSEMKLNDENKEKINSKANLYLDYDSKNKKYLIDFKEDLEKNQEDVFFIKNKKLITESPNLLEMGIDSEEYLYIKNLLKTRNMIWHHAYKTKDDELYSFYRNKHFYSSDMYSNYYFNGPVVFFPNENSKIIKNLKNNIDDLVKYHSKDFLFRDTNPKIHARASQHKLRTKYLVIDHLIEVKGSKDYHKMISKQKMIDEIDIPETEFWNVKSILSDLEKKLDFFGTLKQDLITPTSIPCNHVINIETKNLAETILKNRDIIDEIFKKTLDLISKMSDGIGKKYSKIWLERIKFNYENTYLFFINLYSKEIYTHSLNIYLEEIKSFLMYDGVKSHLKNVNIFKDYEFKYETEFYENKIEDSLLKREISWKDINSEENLFKLIEEAFIKIEKLPVVNKTFLSVDKKIDINSKKMISDIKNIFYSNEFRNIYKFVFNKD